MRVPAGCDRPSRWGSGRCGGATRRSSWRTWALGPCSWWTPSPLPWQVQRRLPCLTETLADPCVGFKGVQGASFGLNSPQKCQGRQGSPWKAFLHSLQQDWQVLTESPLGLQAAAAASRPTSSSAGGLCHRQCLPAMHPPRQLARRRCSCLMRRAPTTCCSWAPARRTAISRPQSHWATSGACHAQVPLSLPAGAALVVPISDVQ